MRSRASCSLSSAGGSATAALRGPGDGIDWYANQTGEVRRFADLSEPERQQALVTVDGHLAAINDLGEQATASQPATTRHA